MRNSARTRRQLHHGIALAAVALAAGIVLPACAGSRRSTRVAGVLRAGIAPIYPPLAYVKDGKLAGVEVDLADGLDEDLDTDIEFVELQWEELIPALQAGRIDLIMSGMSITPERAAQVSFAEPYLQVGQMAVIRKADYLRLYEEGRMNEPGIRVGVLKNTTSESFARESLPRATVVGFDSVDDGITALRGNLVDYFVMDAPGVWKITGGLLTSNQDLRGLYTPLTKEYLAWAVRRDDTALRERLNRVLARWKANGELEEILDKWITVRKRNIEVRTQD